MRPVLDLSSARLETDPYPFSVVSDALCDAAERTALWWFERAAPWNLTEESFYSQHEFDMRGVELPPNVAPLAADSTLAALRDRVAALFRCRLRPAVEMTAHRLTTGQRIRIHDDHRENGETHRLVVQLNRGWTAGDGGYFLLFGGRAPEDLRVVLAPMSRQALFFEISHRSHHAVSKVVRGERYSIVYSFYAISG